MIKLALSIAFSEIKNSTDDNDSNKWVLTREHNARLFKALYITKNFITRTMHHTKLINHALTITGKRSTLFTFI